MPQDTVKFKIGRREYPMPTKLKLGELRVLKREFDLADISRLNKRDPEHLMGLLYIAMRRADPTFSVEDLEEIDLDRIEVIAPEEEGDDDRPTGAEHSGSEPTG